MSSIKIGDLMHRAYEEARPVTAQLELTYKCNLLCSFCYNAPQERKEMNGDQWCEAVDKLKAAGTFTVILTGGEPMIHRDFWKIAERVREQGLVLKAYTNGVLLADEDKVKRWAELAPFDTEISLHGSTAEVHDRLTGMRDSFDKLMVALEHCAKHGIKISLKTPITRLNQHQLAEVRELGARFGFTVTYDTNILPTDDGDTSTFSLAPDKEFLADFFVDQIRKGAQGLNPRPVEKMKQNCGTGRTSITLDPYGDIFPCVAWRRSLGNILEVDELLDLWHGKSGTLNANLAYVRKVASEVPRATLAGRAEGGFASFCPAAAEKETGSAYSYYDAARVSGETKLMAKQRLEWKNKNEQAKQDGHSEKVARSADTA